MAISFNKLNGGAVKSEVKYMKLVEGENTFRILPDSVVPAYTYWVKGSNGKELPFECLEFNRETEKFDSGVADPIKELGVLDADGKPLRCRWSYRCQVINKATGEVEILQLKKGILNDVISVAGQLEIDPSDLDTGTWISVVRKKTGPLPYNVEYTLQQLKCKSTPLEDEYRALVENAKTIGELLPVETYEKQLERLTKHLGGAEESATDTDPTVDKEAVNDLD